jgi:hypothetical protein
VPQLQSNGEGRQAPQLGPALQMLAAR